MLNLLKVMELLRYNVNSNIKRIYEDEVRSAEESSEETASSIFATAVSLIAFDIGAQIYELGHAPKWLNSMPVIWKTLIKLLIKSGLIIVTFILLYLLFFSLFRKGFRVYKHWSYSRKLYDNALPQTAYKKMVDDYDHIACDNIVFAKQSVKFMNKNKNSDKQLSFFYFHEALYYLSKACLTTQILFDHKDDCISNGNCQKGVAFHRLENSIVMMRDIFNNLPFSELQHSTEISQKALESLQLNKDYCVAMIEQLEKELEELKRNGG